MPLSTILLTLLEGFGVTCLLFLVTLLFSIPLGLAVTLGSMNRFRPVRLLTRGFVGIIRGTPLMLQVMIVFYGPGLLFGARVSAIWRELAVCIAFVINYAAYFSEIYRGGIQSVPRGQDEAGLALGMTRRQIFFRVKLLQIVKSIMPAMGNEVITLVKDTSIARVVAVREIIMEANSFATRGYISPLFIAGIFFLVFNYFVAFLLGRIEKRLSYFR